MILDPVVLLTTSLCLRGYLKGTINDILLRAKSDPLRVIHLDTDPAVSLLLHLE